MMNESFKSQLINNAPLYGLIVTINAACISEALSACGFDWLWIDMEHAPFSLGDVQMLAQANRNISLVRIPATSEEWISRVLDLGVEGIIIPHVNSAEEMQKIIPLTYYPPKGQRSLSMARVSTFGLDPNYKEKANASRTLFAQIEDQQGVENIDAIVAVEGVDGIFIGPYDLSGSFGIPGAVDDPQVVAAINKVLAACKKRQKPIGIFAKDAQTARKYAEQGFQLIAVGIDIHYLLMGAKTTLEACLLNSPTFACEATCSLASRVGAEEVFERSLE